MLVSTKTVFGTRRRFSIQLARAAGIALLMAPNAFPGDALSSTDGSMDSQRPTSTFTLPHSPTQGRDPFFPSSKWLRGAYPVPTPTPDPAKLVLKGISGTSDRPLAIINNRTLGVGEEQDVTTSDGRVRVKCLSIDGLKVKIRAQGQTRELGLRPGI